jgi:hypothetical protein
MQNQFQKQATSKPPPIYFLTCHRFGILRMLEIIDNLPALFYWTLVNIIISSSKVNMLLF